MVKVRECGRSKSESDSYVTPEKDRPGKLSERRNPHNNSSQNGSKMARCKFRSLGNNGTEHKETNLERILSRVNNTFSRGTNKMLFFTSSDVSQGVVR